MLKMEKPPDETGFSKCQILTLKYVILLPRLLVYWKPTVLVLIRRYKMQTCQFKMRHENTTARISHIDDHFK